MPKMKKSTLFSLAREGRLTLQIPTLEIWFGNPPPVSEEEYIELDDGDIEELNSSREPTKAGFTFWTPKGYRKFKKEIKAAFETGKHLRLNTWKDFEKHATEYFAERKRTLKKIKDRYKKKIAEINAALRR